MYDRSKILIQGARMLADAAPETFSTPWIDAAGHRHDLDAAGMVALSNAVGEHVRACFLAFSEVVASIESGSITTIAQVDSAPWPENG